MKSPRLSIVTPTRHAPHLLARLIDTLLKQSCGDFEFILVDTSSDDRTQDKWWQNLAPRLDARFRYARVHLQSANMAEAFEYAFNQARGEYVCPTTHKAIWRADAIEHLHRILDRYPEFASFSFKSRYTPVDIHDGAGDLPIATDYTFGSGWDGSAPLTLRSAELFEANACLFGDHGYGGPHILRQFEMPFACHAVYSRELIDRVRNRFGSIVAGKFAADSRLGYRTMDLEAEVHLFPDFEPRISSMHRNSGAAGSQLSSWSYLCGVFETLSTDTKQVISRSPFGYLPLWSVMTYWELYSVVDEARGHLRIDITYPAEKVAGVLRAEIALLNGIDDRARAGMLHHIDAIIARLEGGVLRKWF